MKIKAFGTCTRAEYEEASKALSHAFEVAGSLDNSQVRIRTKIEELELMHIKG